MLTKTIRYPWVGWKCHLIPDNFSIIPPAEHNFEHNTQVSRVTPESIILYFLSIIRHLTAARTKKIAPCELHMRPMYVPPLSTERALTTYGGKNKEDCRE